MIAKNNHQALWMALESSIGNYGDIPNVLKKMTLEEIESYPRYRHNSSRQSVLDTILRKIEVLSIRKTTEILKILVEKGIDIDTPFNVKGMLNEKISEVTPFYFWLFMIEKRSNYTTSGKTLYHGESNEDVIKLTKFFIDNDAELYTEDMESLILRGAILSGVSLAVRTDNPQFVKLLIDSGFLEKDLELYPRSSKRPLMLAFRFGFKESFKAVLKGYDKIGLNHKMTESEVKSCLYEAITKKYIGNNPYYFDILIKEKIDLGFQRTPYDKPFMLGLLSHFKELHNNIAESNHIDNSFKEIIPILNKLNAKVDIVDNIGVHFLVHVLENEYFNSAIYLLKNYDLSLHQSDLDTILNEILPDNPDARASEIVKILIFDF